MKKILLQIFATKIGWLVITCLLFVFFAAFSPSYGILGDYGLPWFDYAAFVSLIYPLGLCLLMIIYAWIINPIKNKLNND